MWEAAAVAGGAGLLGSVLGYIGQEETNDANVALARENRFAQERLSSTAYQRAVADMKAAGLNPALMFGRGQAASTPQIQAPQVENELGRGVSSGLQAAQATSALQQAGALIQKTNAETQNVKADTAIKMVQPENVKAMTAMYGATTAREIATEALTREQIPTIKPLASSRIAHDAASGFNQYSQGGLALDRSLNERRSYGQGRFGRELGSLESAGREVLERLGRQFRRGSSSPAEPLPDYINPMP